MTIKTFEKEIKYYYNSMFPLNMKEVSELKDKHLTTKTRKHADKILIKYGYGKLSWPEYKRRLELMEKR